MTIERAPSTNGHLKHVGATRPEAQPPAAPAPTTGDRTGRTPHRRVGIDIKGLIISALVAGSVAFILRRIDRGAAG